MTDKILINGEEISKRIKQVDGEEALIPAIDDAYCFPELTADVINDIIEGRNVAATGHTGTGKSSLFAQIAARIDQPLIRVNANGQITVGDFVGLWTIKAGNTEWVDGFLPLAMRNGFWLVIEEIDYAEPYILGALNTVLEPGGALSLKEKGNEVIKPHPDFRILATGNTIGCMSEYRSLYQGTNILNEAFLDRWRVYKVNYLAPEKEVKVVVDTFHPRMNEKIAQVIVKVGNMIRESFENEDVSCTFSLRKILDWTSMMLRHRNPLAAAENTIFSKITRDDREVIEGIIRRVMNVEVEKGE